MNAKNQKIVIIGAPGSGKTTLIELLIQKGARMAGPGEFSLRAFMNGKMDLSQTEAIADLISSTSNSHLDTSLNVTFPLSTLIFKVLSSLLIEASFLIFEKS